MAVGIAAGRRSRRSSSARPCGSPSPGRPACASGRFAIEAVLALAVGSILLRDLPARAHRHRPRPHRRRAVRGRRARAGRRRRPPVGHPDHRARAPSPPTSCPHARLALLTLASASGPLCAVVQHLRGEPVDGLLLGGFTIVLLVLVAVRLELVVRSSQAQARREVTVRDAAGALGSSRDAAAIQQVALEAARDLLGVAAPLRGVDRRQRARRDLPRPMLLGPHGRVDRMDAGHRRRPPAGRRPSAIARCAWSTAAATRS